MNSKYLKNTLYGILLAILAFLSYQMLLITLEYFPISTKVGFLRIKQWIFREYDGFASQFWFTAFYIHVATSMLVLIAGFTQFFKPFYRYKIHRNVGKMYVFVVVAISGPTGLIMGYFANGGFWSQLAFILLSVLWIGSTYFAFYKAKKKDFNSHKNWMIISYALTLSALTLRLWKFLITNYTDLDIRPMDLYRIVAWLGWVPNLLVAIWITKIINKKKIK